MRWIWRKYASPPFHSLEEVLHHPPRPHKIKACSDLFSYFVFPALCAGEQAQSSTESSRARLQREGIRCKNKLRQENWSLQYPGGKHVAFSSSMSLNRSSLCRLKCCKGYPSLPTALALEGHMSPVGFVWYLPGLCGCRAYSRASQMALGSYN